MPPFDYCDDDDGEEEEERFAALALSAWMALVTLLAVEVYYSQ
jgi:hypothetical protein